MRNLVSMPTSGSCGLRYVTGKGGGGIASLLAQELGLCVRVKEHLDGLRKGTLSTALGEHKVRRHEDLPIEVAVSILAREPDIAARRTLETFWIAASAPNINRNEECIAVTQELAPFADLCGFHLAGRAQ
ncbi:unnamed protein product [Nippostrongylus brasiliensis]|uniref:DUF4158 domain-containing protein n=1 Tax=Nippostrongylus brasiliensis TaxID=27835 RepID=A0A0N4XDC4_NIPBR|nr:unnamed protein product [Nippostrongylus brasiliensis]